MARVPHESFTCAPGCSVEATLNLIGGKWKGVILYRLLTERVLRFNALRRLLPNITQRMLTNQLRELEGDGLIARKIYPEIPPKVEYRLTDYGMTLAPIIHALKEWGDTHIEITGGTAYASPSHVDAPGRRPTSAMKPAIARLARSADTGE